MDGFFKKRTNESENSKNAKRQKLSSEEIKNLRGDPKVVVVRDDNLLVSRYYLMIPLYHCRSPNIKIQ